MRNTLAPLMGAEVDDTESGVRPWLPLDWFLIVPFLMSLAPWLLPRALEQEAVSGVGTGDFAVWMLGLMGVAIAVPIFVAAVVWLLGALMVRPALRRPDVVRLLLVGWITLLSLAMLNFGITTAASTLRAGWRIAANSHDFFWIGVCVAIAGIASLITLAVAVGRGANKRIERTPRALS